MIKVDSILSLFGLASLAEVNELKKQLNNRRTEFKKRFVDVTLLYLNQDPSLIGADAVLSIPTDKYLQVAPGVFDRALEGPTDIKFDFEEPYRDIIARLNFHDCHVVFVKFEQDGEFVKHYHLTDEIIHYLQGTVRGGIHGEVFNEGDKQIIPAMTIHVFHPLSDGFAIIELYKN